MSLRLQCLRIRTWPFSGVGGSGFYILEFWSLEWCNSRPYNLMVGTYKDWWKYCISTVYRYFVVFHHPSHPFVHCSMNSPNIILCLQEDGEQSKDKRRVPPHFDQWWTVLLLQRFLGPSWWLARGGHCCLGQPLQNLCMVVTLLFHPLPYLPR